MDEKLKLISALKPILDDSEAFVLDTWDWNPDEISEFIDKLEAAGYVITLRKDLERIGFLKRKQGNFHEG